MVETQNLKKSFLGKLNKKNCLSGFLIILGILASLIPGVSPGMALVGGLFIATLFDNPWAKLCSKWSKQLLKIAVIGLGFGMSINRIWEVGQGAVLVTVSSIILTMLLGFLLSRLLKIQGNIGLLISTGTAICGGSAIAAVGSTIKADSKDMAASMGVVFLLNAIALMLFPWLGDLLGLPEKVFGEWAALAIHDTSSVVGACASYGKEALDIGLTFKLTRALWIMPLCFIIGLMMRTKNKKEWPIFLIGFLTAAAISSMFPGLHFVWQVCASGAKQLLSLTLFLIGLSLTRAMIKEVGLKPFILGLVMWIIVSVLSLLFVLS